MIDSLERRTAKSLALLDSEEGQRVYIRNMYEWGLDRKNNICGIIQKATGVIKGETLLAIYERVEAELAARETGRMAG
jgi:phage major head subunit gpT-like protein